MDLEPTLEEVFQEYCLIPPDIFGDKRMYPKNRAFCKCWRAYRKDIDITNHGSFDDSTSCGCALCRLYCTICCLSGIGPALWRMDRGEVKTRLLEYDKEALFDRVHHSFMGHTWTIVNRREHYSPIQFFHIEGMHHLLIQSKPLLILLQHIHSCEAYLFLNHFLDLLVQIRAFGLRRSG
jgi:hypothetical protein